MKKKSRPHQSPADEYGARSHRISYDYQLTYLYGTKMDIMGEISGNKVRISLPSIIDNFARNLVEDTMVTLNVILLHELSHWADERDFGEDFAHSPKWNSVLAVIAYGH